LTNAIHVLVFHKIIFGNPTIPLTFRLFNGEITYYLRTIMSTKGYIIDKIGIDINLDLLKFYRNRNKILCFSNG